MNIQENYNLYIDECGDHNLATYDRNFPIFTLCGILVPVKKINGLKSSIDKLKQDFWGTNDIILHSRDIRKCEKHFQILFDNDVKQRFYTRINDILARQGIYIIVCCSIKKEDCIREHGVEADVYGTALKYRRSFLIIALTLWRRVTKFLHTLKSSVILSLLTHSFRRADSALTSFLAMDFTS